MRIAQFGRDVNDTGGGRVILETSSWIKKQGHEVLIVSDVDLQHLSGNEFITLVAPLGSTLKKWNPNAKTLKIIKQFARMALFTIYGTLISRSLSKKGWVTLNHNIEYLGGDIIILHNVFSQEFKNDPRSLRKFTRLANPVFLIRLFREKLAFILYRERKWIAVSATTEFEALKFLRPRTPVSHINNGVNTEFFHPLGDTQRSKIRQKNNEDDKFIMLFVGHEFEKKGLSYAIESLTLLPEFVTLKVIGGRLSNQKIYEKIVEKNGLSGRIEFLGFKEQTREHYQTADAFVLPSMYEAWPLVGLEAMACGTPALMTEVGGIPEFLRDGINGYMIKMTASDIADKVRTMISMGSEIQNLRKQARNTAMLHSWQHAAEQYLQAAKSVQAARKK